MNVDLDKRIRHLVMRIDELAPAPPLLDGLTVRSSGDRSVSSGSRRLLVPILAAAMVVTVVALLAVRRPDATSSAPLTLQSVSGGLPDGWAVIGGAESTRDPSRPAARRDGAAYATPALPDGPVVVITPSDQSRLDLDQPSSTSMLPDGRRVVIGASVTANLAADVEIGDGRWVSIEAAGIDRDTLRELAARLVLDASGARFDGILPDGLSLVMTTFGLTADPPLAYSPYLDPSSWPPGLAITTYGPTGGSPSTWISMFPASVYSNVLLAITRHPTPLSDDTYAAVEGDRNGVYRLIDGFVVWATSDTLNTEALVKLVDGVHPVSDAVWAKLVAGGTRMYQAGSPDNTVALGSLTTLAPPGPSTAPSPDVDLAYDVTQTADGRVATATLPDGTEVNLMMSSVGRILRITVSLAGTELTTIDLDLNRQPQSGGGASAGHGQGDGAYVYAVIDSNPAGYAGLRVVDGPTTYRTDFADLGGTGMKIGLIVVPPRAGRTNEPAVTVINNDDQVIEY